MLSKKSKKEKVVRGTKLAFKRGGFYTEGDSTTNIFEDPHFALRNLLLCIFHRKDQESLVDLALHLLEYIKKYDSIATTDFWHGTDHSPKAIDGVKYAYSNFQTILLHLKQAGMIKGKKFGRYTLSRKFSYFLDKASDCWRRFFRAEIKLKNLV